MNEISLYLTWISREVGRSLWVCRSAPMIYIWFISVLFICGGWGVEDIYTKNWANQNLSNVFDASHPLKLKNITYESWKQYDMKRVESQRKWIREMQHRRNWKRIQGLEITYEAFIDQTCQTCSVVQKGITVFNIRVGFSTRQQLISAWTFLAAAA